MAGKKKIEIEIKKKPRRNPYAVPAKLRKAGAIEEKPKRKQRRKPRLKDLLGEE